MPNCFSLTRKSDPDAGPVAFVTIDEELCKYLGVECHPTNWYMGWYDHIGLALACGRSFAQIMDTVAKTAVDNDGLDDPSYKQYVKLIVWLDRNFTADVWYAPKGVR